MAWNPEEIVGLLHECGTLALDIQHSAERTIKSDNTVVTEADTRIEALIVQSLSGPENCYFIGEETAKKEGDTYHRDALNGECFVIDPVDGTVLYSNHLPGWGISIGYMNKGVLCEGAILFPISGELIISDGDRVLYAVAKANGAFPSYSDLKPLPAPQPDPASPVISVSQTIVKYGRYNGEYSVLSNGSCVSSMLQLALGGSIAYFTRTRIWDLAAGMPIISKLGIKAFFLDGTEFTCDVHEQSWVIPPADQHSYWRMIDHAVFCASRSVFETVISDSSAPADH